MVLLREQLHVSDETFIVGDPFLVKFYDGILLLFGARHRLLGLLFIVRVHVVDRIFSRSSVAVTIFDLVLDDALLGGDHRLLLLIPCLKLVYPTHQTLDNLTLVFFCRGIVLQLFFYLLLHFLLELGELVLCLADPRSSRMSLFQQAFHAALSATLLRDFVAKDFLGRSSFPFGRLGAPFGHSLMGVPPRRNICHL